MKNKQRTTNNKQRTYKAFTLIELVVAVALLAVVFLFAGVIFKVSINAYRTAVANAEIIQKLRAITDQLNADFKGLRKDGEIFVVWVVEPNSYERFDRIMFFADGDFQSYGSNPKVIHGSVARICYMLANKPDSPNPPIRPSGQEPQKRILARTQHILTDDQDPGFPAFPFSGSDQDWFDWNNQQEYEKMFLEGWKIIPMPFIPPPKKQNVLSVIVDVKANIFLVDPTVDPAYWGVQVDPADASSIHNLLCEGVGEFKVQGWYAAGQRWVPEVDPNGDGDLTDSDFFLSINQVPCVLYPYPLYGFVSLNGVFYCDLSTPAGQAKFAEFQSRLNEERFGEIPGLGRALKFTFTLYDSKAVFKEGRTFTHIVYLGN